MAKRAQSGRSSRRGRSRSPTIADAMARAVRELILQNELHTRAGTQALIDAFLLFADSLRNDRRSGRHRSAEAAAGPAAGAARRAGLAHPWGRYDLDIQGRDLLP